MPTQQLRPLIRRTLAGEAGPHEMVLSAINRRGRPILVRVAGSSLNRADGSASGAILLMESVIHVTGEVDLLTGPLLHDHLSALLTTRPERLIIDLSHVTFLGATGLTVLINTRRAAAQQGTTLQLRGTSQHAVARVLKITGLDYLFETLPPAPTRS